MDYKTILNYRIYERCKDIPNLLEATNYQLAYIFECFSAIKLTEQYGKQLYLWDDINPVFKEDNNFTKKDSGIDLCDLSKNIVQCKLRKQQLNWKELSTFIASSQSYDEEKEELYVKWKPILTRNSCCGMSSCLQDHLRFKRFIDIPYELKEVIEYCNNLLTNPPLLDDITPIDFQERDYQTEAIRLINYNNSVNVYLCLPTGSGKNYIMIRTLDIKSKTLILVPRRILVNQLKEEMVRFRPELQNKIQCIGDGNSKYSKTKNITICVYNSINIVENLHNYDRIFIDEAHYIYRPDIYEYEDVYIQNDQEDTYISKIRKYIDHNKKCVLLSATLDKPYDDNDIYYKVDIRELIDKDVLTDYLIKIPIFEEANNRSVCQYLIQNYSHLILYCSSHDEGIKITRIMNELLDGCCDYIDCHIVGKKRDMILQRFQSGKLKYIVNIKVLIEGFNAPITNGVVLMNISKNDKIIIQILGRSLRKYNGKQYAYLILPFINDDDNKELEFVLQSLSNNDTEIKKRCMNKKLGGYIDIETVRKNIEKDEDDIEEENIFDVKYDIIYNSIGECIKNKNIKFNEKCELLLQECMKINKLIPRSCVINGFNIGRFLDYMKTKCNKNTWTSEEKDKLLENPYFKNWFESEKREKK